MSHSNIHGIVLFEKCPKKGPKWYEMNVTINNNHCKYLSLSNIHWTSSVLCYHHNSMISIIRISFQKPDSVATCIIIVYDWWSIFTRGFKWEQKDKICSNLNPSITHHAIRVDDTTNLKCANCHKLIIIRITSDWRLNVKLTTSVQRCRRYVQL